MTETNANLRIWNAVEKTDPAHTKKVNQRGGFTAISAHYQIMRATEVFGPVGIGWGYTNGDPVFTDGLVIVPVTIWHGDRSNTFGPLYGSAEMKPVSKAGPKLDSDAPKKASTDGLTKGLSQLGFNADVFLGKFDDNKYIAAMTDEFAPKADVIDDHQRAHLMTLAEQAGADMRGFCTFYKIGALPELPADRYEHAKGMLEKKLAAKNAAPQQEAA
ncbi:hypothetical protein [Sphingomonas albertensis]|uniref:Uncharacterized protein n=1 Tax=Sphingomonas albertensis TaxID=2762591 RepID=A0ABR7AS98_9SPHN|nr:hypothetical protein [Sphingomonas albertensis]MBC3943336.1 hypothetical protein [Sphingomonas albertensis]